MIIKLRQRARNLIFTAATLVFPTFKAHENLDLTLSTVLYHEAVDMCIYSFASFFFSTGFTLPIVAINDGSLTAKDKKRLSRIFTITFIDKRVADHQFTLRMKRFRNFLKYRLDPLSAPTKRKFDALIFSPTGRLIYLEPDVLIHAPPCQIINWIKNLNDSSLYLKHNRKFFGSYNREDLDYNIRRLIHLNTFKLTTPDFNSGVLCIADKDLVDFHKLEQIFTFFNRINYTKAHCAEETALAIIFTMLKNRSLSSKKYLCPVLIREYQKAISNNKVLIHYIGESKMFFERDAIRLALKTNLFRG